MNSKTGRRSGMELLRIFAIMSVIILHYFNSGIGGGTNYIHGTVGVFINHLFMTLAFCAVDLFVMISAYFISASSKRSFSKIVFLLFEASILRTITYVITSIVSSEPITVSGIINSIIVYGYFIVFYSIIYLVSPLINISFDKLDKKNCKKAVVLLFTVFSIIPAITLILSTYNVLNVSWLGNSTVTKEGNFEGYSIVNFFLCYVIGYYIRHWHNEKKKLSKILTIFALNTAALLIWGYLSWQSPYTYDNPFVILEAALLIMIFKDMEFKSKLINELASSGFTCYLVHGAFLSYIGIAKYASRSWYVMLAHVIVSTVGIYLICYVIHKIYGFCTNWFVRKLSPAIDKINLTVYEKDSEA